MLVPGVANLLADGFSMGMSNYLSRRSEIDYRAAAGTVGADTAAKTALATFLAFVTAGWMPLFPYVVLAHPPFAYAVAVTGAAFFVVGASRNVVTNRSWYVNGTEMLAVGMLAATVAFTVGTLLRGLA